MTKMSLCLKTTAIVSSYCGPELMLNFSIRQEPVQPTVKPRFLAFHYLASCPFRNLDVAGHEHVVSAVIRRPLAAGMSP